MEPQVDSDLARAISITSQRFNGCACSKRTIKLIPIPGSRFSAGLEKGHDVGQGQGII